MTKSRQREINDLLGKSVIAYQPLFTHIFGSLPAGVMLSQLLYWEDKGWKKGWTYKTVRDMYDETGLTRTQQETAIRVLKKHGVLEVKRKGIPATRHFRVNFHRLRELLPSLQETRKLESIKPANQTPVNKPTNTKSTQNTTSLITLRNEKRGSIESVGDILRNRFTKPNNVDTDNRKGIS